MCAYHQHTSHIWLTLLFINYKFLDLMSMLEDPWLSTCLMWEFQYVPSRVVNPLVYLNNIEI